MTSRFVFVVLVMMMRKARSLRSRAVTFPSSLMVQNFRLDFKYDHQLCRRSPHFIRSSLNCDCVNGFGSDLCMYLKCKSTRYDYHHYFECKQNNYHYNDDFDDFSAGAVAATAVVVGVGTAAGDLACHLVVLVLLLLVVLLLLLLMVVMLLLSCCYYFCWWWWWCCC